MLAISFLTTIQFWAQLSWYIHCILSEKKENRFIYPYVTRDFNKQSNGLELGSLSENNSRERFDSKPSRSTSSKSLFQYIHHIRSDINPVEHCDWRQLSLYDFRFGISALYLSTRDWKRVCRSQLCGDTYQTHVYIANLS